MSKERYLNLPLLQAQLPVFFQPWWLDIVSSSWDMALSQAGDGAVNGVWPLAWDTRLGLRIARNPLLTPYMGPFFTQPLTPEQQAGVFEELWQQLPRRDNLDLETTVDFHQVALLEQKGCTVSEKVTFEIDLSPEEEQLFSAMHSNHRNLIRQAAMLHIVTEGEAHLGPLIDMHKATFTRKHKPYPFPPAMIHDLVQTAIQRDSGCLWALRDEQDRITATIFTVWDQRKMYLLLSANDPASAHPGAVRLLIWHALKAARQKGLAAFDFEGSMDPGIAAFFRRFGGNQKTYLCASGNRSLLWKVKKTILG